MLLAEQLVRQRYVRPGPLVLGTRKNAVNWGFRENFLVNT